MFIPASTNEPREDNRAESRDDSGNTVSRPIATLAEEVNEQAIQIVVVIVMGLCEHSERRVQFAHELERPDLIHPEIVHGGAHSEQYRHGDDNNANRCVN